MYFSIFFLSERLKTRLRCLLSTSVLRNIWKFLKYTYILRNFYNIVSHGKFFSIYLYHIFSFLETLEVLKILEETQGNGFLGGTPS